MKKVFVAIVYYSSLPRDQTEGFRIAKVARNPENDPLENDFADPLC
jgi:hypothetical protein